MPPTIFEAILIQLLQPYFYYSATLLTVSSICVKAILRYCYFLGGRVRSITYLTPLTIPIFVMMLFHPKTTARITCFAEAIIRLDSGRIICRGVILSTEITSITGILCLTGLILGGAFSTTMILLGDKIATKLFHVTMLTHDDYPWLWRKVDEISRRLSLPAPRIGVIEDLRPNAFTIGYGRKAILVFSVGLLNLLNEDELAAVTSHELVHLKNGDFFFKTISNTLNIISFFNPFAYIMSSAAQREREALADESGAELLEEPKLLAKTLVKVYEALKSLPREGIVTCLSSALLLTFPITRKPRIYVTHPPVSQRVRNIIEKSNPPKSYNIAVILTLLIVFGGVAASYLLVNIQTSLMQSSPLIVFIPPHHPRFTTMPVSKHIYINMLKLTLATPELVK